MLKSVSSITNSIGALNYKGTWNANTNSPALASGVGTKGDYYVVGTAGTTALDGISNWGIGDWAAFNGSVWQRVEGGADLNGVNLTVSGTSEVGTVKSYTEGVVAIGTVGASHTIDLTNGTIQTATLTASTATTFTMPTATAGKSFVLFLKQAASTGNGTATFTGVKWNAAGAPTITALAGKMDILSFFSDGTNWYGSINQGFTP